MESKKIYKFIFLMLSIFFVITDVYADECSTQEYRELKQLANEINFSYEFDSNTTVFKVNIYNFDKKFYIISSDLGYIEYKSNKQYIGNYIKGGTYKVNVYASNYSNCGGEKLTTLKFYIPTYNNYYTWEECNNNRELDICKKWYDTSDISEEEFKKEIQKHNENSSNKDSFVKLVVSFLKNNYIYVLTFLGLSTLIVVIYIVVKNSRRKKIDW